ncbi:MAG: hypothetical protein C5B48_15010 [Candidatus Rokuibacteriota bacterium]|nr:MAG: hypothetical protein C5B48_15010 [Candidatus Rokubacteria bacterium]
MSTPEAIVQELRAARPLAPERLREHVLALGEPAVRPRRSWRRPALVLVPATVLASGAAALILGLVQSGGNSRPVVQRGELSSVARAPQPLAGSAPTDRAAALPAPGTRAKRYEAELTLRVRDLSTQTKRALRLTRELGGYVRSVDYGQGQKAGTAYLVVRVPVQSVQGAIVRFSALGEILAQHVSIQDAQAGLDRRFREIRALERRIVALEREGTPDAVAKAALLRPRLVALQRVQAQAIRQASFATVSLALRTKEAAVTPQARPGRIRRTLDRAGTVLVEELAVVLYVLIVALPLLLLGAAAYFGARALRRRSLDRLLQES